jgi:hypothetical protein
MVGESANGGDDQLMVRESANGWGESAIAGRVS